MKPEEHLFLAATGMDPERYHMFCREGLKIFNDVFSDNAVVYVQEVSKADVSDVEDLHKHAIDGMLKAILVGWLKERYRPSKYKLSIEEAREVLDEFLDKVFLSFLHTSMDT